MTIMRIIKLALGYSFLWPLLSWGGTINSTPGDIVMNGELIESTCTIEPVDDEIWVNFGDISAREFQTETNLLMSKTFQLKLVGCTLPSEDKRTGSRAQITMMGDSVDSDRLLEVTGDINGVGIQLKDNHGHVVMLNTQLPDYILLENSDKIDLTAILIAYKMNVKAGAFTGVLRFRMDYF
ncbi:PAP fimbrial minor pilin protein [Providencia manganoxydans]|uniref:fimbrial protein n=2 Tax=Providencia manganoxydans TaxID=2923283 RepID=UPI003BA1FF1D